MSATPLNKILGMEENTSATSVSIQIASPEVIRSWSRGEVKNPETINYRSFKPEKGGLFCERIFGPTRDWECNCGKYKRIKHKGVVCDRCGVEVTHSRVRRERMGHIELAVPVTHVWFFKCIPSRVGLILNQTVKSLERVVYYEDWIVTDPGETPLEYKQILTDAEYREARELYGDSFEAGMGAAAMQKLLRDVNLDELLSELRTEMETTKSKANRRKIAKRLRLVEGFCNSGTRPEWMVLDVMPVIPPDLRPLVPLEGGRFASSDLNDLYRRVINRNNRLKHLLHLRTPEVIIRNEKRMLQESVDALLDNGRHGRPVTGTGNRPLKSLSDMLKGKGGRFRQNLLGKRVDYSGRSVIVVGPELKLGQCGLPKKMALTLFEPFIISQLKRRGLVHTVRSAKKMIERRDSIVWDVLEEVIDGHPVLLNRAPTLHRLSIQAFDPILIEGRAIRLHPLVCSAYNADFDGDQMAVHVQLSNESQLEAKLLMMANLNIFSPADGRPVTTPTQDITLGLYYLTYHARKDLEPRSFSNYHEALFAYDERVIKIHDPIVIPNQDFGLDTLWGDSKPATITTTIGRCIFNEIWPDELGFYNDIAPKKGVSNMVTEAYRQIGREGTVEMLDKLKAMGYKFATQSGFSIGITDMIIPEEKKGLLGAAQEEVAKVRKQREEGVITNLERYNKCIDIWTKTNSALANTLYTTLKTNDGNEEINPVYAMLDSGARGSKDQIRQLSGMRGLMAKPNGDIIERPILSNFREGLDVLEYFISSHGARKGLADTALKTADSGYMTRKLVDVAQDVICSEIDCGTLKGIVAKAIIDGDETMLPLCERIVGRFVAEDIKDPLHDGEYIIRANELIDEEIAAKIEDVGIEEVMIRSTLTCESEQGVCATCYGMDLSLNNTKMVEVGSSLGIIAAQSIGEPGTQLTMRTFHLGGTASASFREPVHKARTEGTLKLENARTVEQEDGTIVVLNKHANVILENKKGVEVESNKLYPGTVLYFKEGEKVKVGAKYAEWDAYNVPIITEQAGTIEYKHLVDGVTMNRVKNKKTGAMEISVMEHHGDMHPQLLLLDEDGEMIDHFSLPGGTTIVVADGDVVKPGVIVARTPRQSSKTKDITGGLPRVAELLEARIPKDAAEVARIDGIVEISETVTKSNKRPVIIRDPETGQDEKHLVPVAKRIVVYNGDYVKKGQPLTDGSIDPHDILDVCGARDLQEYLVNEVQMVYRLQGVEINDKHVEIITRQMLRKVRITDPGSTEFIFGEEVDKKAFYATNAKAIAEGGQPAEADPVLLGITKASLATESFISAASFQDTTRILTDAATYGKVDVLKGFKENVIMGQLIPAGTGHVSANSYKVVKTVSDLVEIDETEVTGVTADLKDEEDAIANAKALLDL